MARSTRKSLAGQAASAARKVIGRSPAKKASATKTTAKKNGAVAKAAPASAHVVKAFNTLFGPVLARSGRLDAFIAADDLEAKARVSTFIESLGLRPFDVGGLHMASTLESLGLMLIGLAKNGAGTFDIALTVDVG